MKTTTTLTLAFTLALTLITPATGQVPDQLKYGVPPVGVQSGAGLGSSMAFAGSLLVAGAPYDDLAGVDSGAVKVFDSMTGALLHILPNPNPQHGSRFGGHVALSGTRVVVGVPEYRFGGLFRVGIAYVYDLAGATPTVPVATLQNPSPAQDEYFGGSVAISGTRVLVGAPGDSTVANVAGSAYLYNLNGATPSLPVLTLNAPSAAAGDRFGGSVDIDVTRAVIGASGADSGSEDAGRAYVYDVGSATPKVPIATLNNPESGVQAWFGSSTAISGTRVIVGARGGNNPAVASGNAYVYNLASATPTVPVVTLRNPSPSPGSGYYGTSVAISGTRAVVGAPYNQGRAGAAYVYNLASVTPASPVALINPSPSPSISVPAPLSPDIFGTSVAISGTAVAVGAPGDGTAAFGAGSVYLYELASVTPSGAVATLNNPGPSLGDEFGNSVAISGTLMVVGAWYAGNGNQFSGAVFVYDLASATPAVPVTVLRNPGPADVQYFGYSVAISGTRVVVGAPYSDVGDDDSGSAYVYDLSGATPTVPVTNIHDPGDRKNGHFGYSVAISNTHVLIGAPGAFNDYFGWSKGYAYVYNFSSPTPTGAFIEDPAEEDEDEENDDGGHFGFSVAISGALAVIGAPGDLNGSFTTTGIAYVYDLTSVSPTIPAATLNPPFPENPEHFGYSVAISGTRVVVDDPSYGGTHVYDLASATPTVPVVTLAIPGLVSVDRFGHSVAIDGTRVVVGTPYYSVGAIDAGSAYAFDLTSPTPSIPVATLLNPNPAFGDYFGRSIAIVGSTIAVGAPGNDAINIDKGYAYVFGPSPYSLWKVSELSDQFSPDLGDGDGDGLGNLGEYGLLRSPTTPESASFGAESALYAEGERLRLFVPRDPARNDITLEVQAAGDLLLGPWTTIATSTLGAPFTGPGYFGGDSATPGVKSVEVRDTVYIPDAPQRFLRVRVRR